MAPAAEDLHTHLTILRDVSESLGRMIGDPTSVFEFATRELADIIGDACVLALVDEEREHLVPTVFHHRDPYGEEVMRDLYLGGPVDMGRGLAGEVAATGVSVRISGIPMDQMKASVEPRYRPYVEQFDTSSVLIVPLMDSGTVIGTLGLSREAEFSELDEQLATDLATLFSLAIVRTRLEEESHRSLELLTTITNSLPAMIGYWNSDVRNEFANDAYVTYFGQSPEQMRGKHGRDLLGPALFEQNVGYMKAALA